MKGTEQLPLTAHMVAVTTAAEFENWVNNADPGEWCQYHVGRYLYQTTPKGNLVYREPRGDKKTGDPIEVATKAPAQYAYELGLVCLVQRRLTSAAHPTGCGTFEYLAVRRNPAKVNVSRGWMRRASS